MSQTRRIQDGYYDLDDPYVALALATQSKRRRRQMMPVLFDPDPSPQGWEILLIIMGLTGLGLFAYSAHQVSTTVTTIKEMLNSPMIQVSLVILAIAILLFMWTMMRRRE